MSRQRQLLLAVRVWWLEHFAGAAKKARFRQEILWFVAVLWLFSRVWYACSENDLWIQLANVSAQERTERFFNTTSTLRSETVIVIRPRTTKTVLKVCRQKIKNRSV